MAGLIGLGRRMSFRDTAKSVYAAGTAMQCSDCGYSALQAIYSNRRVTLEIARVEIQYVGASDAEGEMEVEEAVQPSQRTRHFQFRMGTLQCTPTNGDSQGTHSTQACHTR
jgi:hypothetical protein